MVAPKRPHGRRLLLPAEVELCNVLGITKDEYWIFVDQTASYNGTRPEGYELIPDIRCDPVTAFIAKNIVSIGIAVVSAAVSYLLTPKPKEQKQGGSKRTADSVGSKKFAPQASFDSIQELAVLGDAIPLIFTKQIIENEGQIYERIYGGVRVNSQLLWSQFLSMGKYQQLKVLALFSFGNIPNKINNINHPNYAGFAIGDTLLNTYNSHKVGLYFRHGASYSDSYVNSAGTTINFQSNRSRANDRYGESNLVSSDTTDPFIVHVPDKDGGTSGASDKNKAFCGARNPTTQVSFGTYSAIPNAQLVKLPYELVMSSRGTSKEAHWDNARKKKKVLYAHWPVRAGIISVVRGASTLSQTTTTPIDGQVGDIVTYQIIGRDSGVNNALQRVYDTNKNEDTEEGEGYQEDPFGNTNYDAFGYKPHGVDDVDSMTISIRENVDSLIAVGEQYLFGTAVMQCTEISSPVPFEISTTKHYKFKVIEAGRIDIPLPTPDLTLHCTNPAWHVEPGQNETDRYSLSSRSPILYRQKLSGVLDYGRGTRDLYHGHDIYSCQRIAFATVSNNKNCDVTEIGIKSKVFKQMRFANVNSQPGEKALQRAYSDRTHIQLGQVDRYLPRMSFFMLQVRKIGQTSWNDMKNTVTTSHTGLFAIRGNSPEFQYNSIAIEQEPGQFEYRFKPYPGNYFTRDNNFGKEVNILIPSTDDRNRSLQHYSVIIAGVGGFNILFSGEEAKTINENDVYINNQEWNIEASTKVKDDIVTKVHFKGDTEWKSDLTYDGRASYHNWVNKGLISGADWRIKYNDPSNSPAAPGTYVWNLYTDNVSVPTGLDAKQTAGGDPGPGLGNWRDVYFIVGNTLYQPSQNAAGGHPQNLNYLFYVRKYEWEAITPTPFFTGSVPIIHNGYVGRGIAGSLKVKVTIYKSGDKYHITWVVDPEFPGSEYDTYHSTQGLFIPEYSNGLSGTRILPNPVQIQLEVGKTEIDVPEQTLNRFDVIKDWNIYEGDVNSNRNEPEHQICFVNEIVRSQNPKAAAQYTDLAYAGLVINSSKEWTNFSQFSAYFKQGIAIEGLITPGTGASNLFPEIAHALLTSSKIGAGKLVGTVSVDRPAMTDAARFCQANKFFWDGVISSKLNLRDFIFEHAGYCLLDFTIIGGKFSLKPSVPIKGNGNYEIDYDGKPDIKCLFTDGNIQNLQVSFLSPEERQLFRAAVLYRKETVNGFPETKSVIVTSGFGSTADPIETFDMSGFCTNSDQAIAFAKYAINLRRLSDHGVSFTTAPQYVQFLSPGDYFRLVSEVTHTSRFRNGAKLDDGTIVSKDDMTGSESVLYWIPGKEGEILSSTLSAAPDGCLFTVKNETTENKVYKCETISYAEDGLIEVAGSYAPTEANTGYLSVLQNWASQFTVQED